MERFHSISVDTERLNGGLLMSFKALGKVSHADYMAIKAVIESALRAAAGEQIRVLVDVTEFEGWELHAAWDDVALALRHSHDFYKIAVLGNSRWQKLAAMVGNWFVDGESRYFEDKAHALSWLQSE
ncbi:STAS/SEC14 domain-containing protein [Pseudoalteromonas sp. DL2-H2.2]|uniref:STAS/SEC14 domain-containing protein n=1 Tax=Pseudoalteromonas sp. DL2-H2.2 TaxID=2908889 RepID=UPI001F30F9EB|nr:STAS/SEC14 domain-containing protein [Pseudoalteromonas sp. DL2-H2.2]MCF2910648.1 STAS/SEC14 domain-containing protein [Pseudoalteromonas sp. DL2-H2.2]